MSIVDSTDLSRKGYLPMRAFLIFALLSLANASPSRATSLLRFDLEDLTANAAQIFVGTCTASSTELVDGRVYTRIHFDVSQSLKGDLPDQVAVYLPGGEHQGTRVQIVGMPTFAPEEEIVLFLTAQNQRGHAWPVGLAQGKFHIERRGAAQKARVLQNLDGLSFYAPTGTAKSTDKQADLGDMALEEFLAQIRALTGAERGGDDVH